MTRIGGIAEAQRRGDAEKKEKRGWGGGTGILVRRPVACKLSSSDRLGITHLLYIWAMLRG